MKLIIGLGNPGKQYEKTRHNIGFFLVDEYVGPQKWSTNEFANFFQRNCGSKKVIFVKPLTYMNESGQAVRYFINYYKIDLHDVLIIHDDLDLESGAIKLKNNSSSGGHNGIQSIINALGTMSFLRLKIGISKPADGDTIDYVLHRLTKKDRTILNNNLPLIREIIKEFIDDCPAEQLMNKYN